MNRTDSRTWKTWRSYWSRWCSERRRKLNSRLRLPWPRFGAPPLLPEQEPSENDAFFLYTTPQQSDSQTLFLRLNLSRATRLKGLVIYLHLTPPNYINYIKHLSYYYYYHQFHKYMYFKYVYVYYDWYLYYFLNSLI